MRTVIAIGPYLITCHTLFMRETVPGKLLKDDVMIIHRTYAEEQEKTRIIPKLK